MAAGAQPAPGPRDLLLNDYVSAVTDRANRRAKSHDYSPKPADVERWLRRLALHLDWQRTYLSTAPTRPPGLSDVDIVPHLLWPIAGWTRVRALHLTLGIAIPIVLIAILSLRAGERGLAANLIESSSTIASFFDLPSGSRPFISVVLLLLLACFVGVATSLPCRIAWPRPLNWMKIGRSWPDRLRAVRTQAARSGLIWAIITAAAAGGILAIVSIAGAEPLHRTDIAGITLVVIAFLVTCGGIGGFAAAVLSGLDELVDFGFFEWDGQVGKVSSRAAIRSELRSGLTLAAICSTLASLIIWALTREYPAAPDLGEIWIGALMLYLVGALVAFNRASVRYALALVVAWRRGMLPLRFGRFLDWANEVGLLRTSGAAYQFRHLELQRWLVEQG